jgi:hypothetical protein
LHEELWRQLGSLDRQKTSQRAKCLYVSSSDRYIIKLLNTEYVVSLLDRDISVRGSKSAEPAEFLEQLCLLTYLINAKNLPLANKLAKAESLPGGGFFFRGPHMLPTQKLAEAFGANCSLLYRAGIELGAEKCDFGDASIELLVLPRVPLTFVVWGGDDEFDARASILFDKTACEQLPLDALGAVVNLAVNAVIKSVAASG